MKEKPTPPPIRIIKEGSTKVRYSRYMNGRYVDDKESKKTFLQKIFSLF